MARKTSKTTAPAGPIEVAVVGAGPAGGAVAAALARLGRRVLLIDRHAFPRPASCAGWVSARAVPLLDELGVKTKGVLNQPFRDVTLLSDDFTKQSKPCFTDTVGYLVDRATFDQGIVEAAVGAGATFLPGSPVADIKLNEAGTELRLEDGQTVKSRLLVLASGRDPQILARVGFLRFPHGSSLLTAQVEADAPRGARNADPKVYVVLGIDGGKGFGFIAAGPRRTIVNVSWRGEAGVVHQHLANVCRRAVEHKLIPTDLTERSSSAEIIRSPAAVALDMDTHVGKHTLLIGDAGGFVSAGSNEGIYPAIWSATLAAKAIVKALDSRYSQDDLMSFDSLWRMAMADHLRLPHTDIRFLLPLIFSNQPMADRMGAAFFFGDNI
ncbi:MAG: NAD(P)/FAD-dependent oxidoreductase [Planctomycetota bacterium]|mgnify:CR=1 FL=1